MSIIDQEDVIEEELTTYFRSVILFGKARILQEDDEIYHAIETLGLKYNEDEVAVEKEILHYSIELGSCCLDQPIKELGLPKECVILSINRGIEEIVPRGDTVLHLGDHLTILVNKENREVTKDILHKFFTLEI